MDSLIESEATSDMTDDACIVCGDSTSETGLPYRCAYCGKPVCRDHRLPENHGCSGERLSDRADPEGREPQPMTLDQNQTLGTTPTDIGQPSPDVAIDGSIAGEQENAIDENDTDPWWRRLLPW